MTHRQRILAAAARQPIDRVPFGARIDLWYNYHAAKDTLPARYKGWSMVDVLRDLGAGFQVRPAALWKEQFKDLEVTTRDEGPVVTNEYKTPMGTITSKIELNQAEGYIVGYTKEHLFKSERDYPAIEYLLNNTLVSPDYSAFLRAAEEIGEDGIIRCGFSGSPMQYIMRDLMGYETFFYELADHPTRIEHLYETVKELWKKRLDVIAGSPARIVNICSNWSDDIHTPVFRKYFAPWLRETSEFLHAKGKLTMVHADGEMRRLIPLVLDTGIDVAEAWSPAPMTLVTTRQLREAWGDRIAIWGGLPTTVFEPTYSDAEFEAYVINLFKEIAPGYGFIIGMGDNFPIDGNIERVRRVVELIAEYGTLPITI